MSGEASNQVKPTEQSEARGAGAPTAVHALRLGWLTAEIYGLVRRGALRHQDYAAQLSRGDVTPRLTFSDRDWKSASRLLTSDLHMLRQLASELGLWPDEEVGAPILPETVNRILIAMQQTKRNELPTVPEMFQALEQWSFYVQGALLGAGERSMKAFSYGASLADTYWYMCEPPAKGRDDGRESRETWRKLLRHYRLREESRRIGELADVLDPRVAAALRYSARRWGIESDIKALEKSGEFEPAVEQKMMTVLRRQAFAWRDLVLGLRRPVDFLSTRDKIWIWIGRQLLFAGVAFLSLIVLVITVAAALNLLIPLFLALNVASTNTVDYVAGLFAGNQVEVGDLLQLVTMVGAFLGAIWAAGKFALAILVRLYAWSGDVVETFAVQRRVLELWKPEKGKRS